MNKVFMSGRLIINLISFLYQDFKGFLENVTVSNHMFANLALKLFLF